MHRIKTQKIKLANRSEAVTINHQLVGSGGIFRALRRPALVGRLLRVQVRRHARLVVAGAAAAGRRGARRRRHGAAEEGALLGRALAAAVLLGQDRSCCAWSLRRGEMVGGVGHLRMGLLRYCPFEHQMFC